MSVGERGAPIVPCLAARRSVGGLRARSTPTAKKSDRLQRVFPRLPMDVARMATRAEHFAPDQQPGKRAPVRDEMRGHQTKAIGSGAPANRSVGDRIQQPSKRSRVGAHKERAL